MSLEAEPDTSGRTMSALATDTPDRLSKLPTELLDMISDQAWAKQRPSGPINRALCPFYDRFAWRSIRIDSPARLARFFQLTDKRTHLGLLCEELVVQLKPAELDVATLTGLLGRTPNLKKLALADLANDVFERVLSGTKSKLLPMHLRKFDLTCTTGDRKDPYHPTTWSLFNDLQSLNQLALDLRSAETPTGRIKSKKELPAYADITDLENPGLLRELVLEANPKKGWTLPDELEQLTSLHSLKLVGDWHRLAPSDIERICDLPLRRFELGSNSELCLQSFYEALQLGKLPTLQELHFDNLTSQVGTEVYDEDLPWSWERQIEAIRDCMWTWDRAKWTRHFQLVTFRVLQNLCSKRNIKISGTASRASDVETELCSMQRDIDRLKTMIRSRGTGAYRGINEGRSYADDDEYFDRYGDRYGRYWY